MKKEGKELLRTIISNQELIMKALKIEIPVKIENKVLPKKAESKVPAKKVVQKKIAAKKKK